jgi:tRNA1(Val) A37 N6-methylase TrmN6
MRISGMFSAPATEPGAVTTDAFLGGRVILLQPGRGHRSGSDAVFLAAAAPARPGDRVLEAGAGAGVASLCLHARVPSLNLSMVERDESLCDLARANAARCGAEAEIHAGDILPSGAAERIGVARDAFDHVFANPPFYDKGASRPRPGAEDAHVMPAGGLDAWLRFLASVAKPGASLTLIHRPEALPEILASCDRRFGGVTVFPLFPREGAAAERILVRATKASRKKPTLLQGMTLHTATGAYTRDAEAVLRDGAALDLG